MKKLWAFLISLALYAVIGSSGDWIMHGYKNCDFCFSCHAPFGCASDTRVLIADICGYSAVGFLLLAFILPLIIWRREHSQKPQQLFDIAVGNDEPSG